MSALPIPLSVILTAASRVLRAGPGYHGQQMWLEEQAFRATLERRGCPSRIAEAYATSFSRAVEVQVEAAPGGVLQ